MEKITFQTNCILSTKKLIYLVFFLFSTLVYSQVRVPFAPRTASATPGTTIYHVKGDFTLIGNTNLTLTNSNYGDNTNNSNNVMEYVDSDSDNDTFNSSSADLTFSTENGAVPACSNVVFAGLYWTGRASNSSSSPDIFDVTQGGVTKTFNKRKVKLKEPSSASYTEITANTNDIYYPNNSDGFMYSAYAEITDYVQTNGLGEYTVADIALIEGNGGGTGYYGGWGIIVVYENSKMKWRDVTVFDGHAYVQGNTTVSHQIPISGFNAVQTGQVNVKLGLMAGEGDVGISGDYFNILRSSDNNWQSLSHTGNSTNNFFNGSIQTGGNPRTPNLQNNTGLDISMFDIPNTGNSVIANSQTSTTLRYGSTQDTYIIFMAAFAVDAYIPDAEGVMSLITINGLPPTPSLTVQPGEEIEYSIKILNEGTEPVNNTVIKIQMPYTVDFIPGSEQGIINFTPLPTPNNLSFNPTLGGNGTLFWDIGTLPVPAATPTDILGELKFKVKVTEDCFLLKNLNCTPSVPLYGYISGVGGITGIVFNDKPFIQGYETSGTCIGDPITDPIVVNIDSADYIDQNCQDTETHLTFSYCGTSTIIPFNDVATNFPTGTQFYDSYPVTVGSTEYTNSNTFPTILGATQYYAVPPVPNGCYFTFTISVVDSPTVTTPSTENIDGCSTSAITPLVYSETSVDITLQEFIDAGGTVSNNSLSYDISYIDVSSGSCPLVVTRTFTVITSCSNHTLNQIINIYDNTPPVIEPLPLPTTIDCPATPVFAQATASDNCGSDFSLNFIDVTTPGDCAGSYSVTRNWTATDACGNVATASQTLNVQDISAPVIDALPAPSTIDCPATPVFAQATASDNCGSDFTLNFIDVTTPGDCAGSYSVTRNWTATDACGNVATASQTINVQDISAPVIDPLPAPSTIDCPATPVFAQATASDNCGSDFTLNFIDVTTPGDCAGSYSITRNWTATDACGNVATASQTINVQDISAPVIDPLPAPSTIDCPATPVFAQATATDICGSDFTLTYNDVTTPGDCAGSYSITRNWTATDACGNVATASQTINVQDISAPVIDPLPAPSTIDCPATPVFAQATATDNCGSDFSLNFIDVTTPGDCAGSYSITRNWTATDACGNVATASQTINVQDISAPVIDPLPAPSTIDCPATPVFAQATATDICGSDFTLTYNDVTTPGDCAGSYSITRNWTATDACGNVATASQTINVQDITNPYFISDLPEDISVSCDEVPSPEELEASDNCSSEVTITVSDEIITDDEDCAGVYSIIRTWTATDECFNSISHIQTITIYDNTPPELITPLDEEINVVCNEIPEIPELEFEDNCSGVYNVEFSETITVIDIYQYTLNWQWIASDNCGNEATFSQTINVGVPEPFDAIPYAICTEEQPIDLFTILGEQIPTNGEWTEVTNSGGLNGSIFNPINVSVGYYTLQYTVSLENDDCPSVFEIYLNVNDDCVVLAACDINIYNAVSPNNDGMNDIFLIDGIECYPDNSVEIYNRWGILVYETRGYDNLIKAFKGYSEGRTTFNKNELLPDGTYFYVLKFEDEEGKSHDRSGYLYLDK